SRVFLFLPLLLRFVLRLLLNVGLRRPTASHCPAQQESCNRYLNCEFHFVVPSASKPDYPNTVSQVSKTDQSVMMDAFSESCRWGDVLTAVSSIALMNCPCAAMNVPLMNPMAPVIPATSRPESRKSQLMYPQLSCLKCTAPIITTPAKIMEH